MNTSNPQIEHLKRMLGLEEKRAALQQQLRALDTQLDSLKRQLISGAPVSAAKAVPAKAPSKPAAPKKAPSGQLKSQIFAALEKAGSAGVKVMDVARALRINPANVYAWFHAAVKRYPVIKKTGAATYKLTGKIEAKKVATPAKAPAKKAPAAPATKAPAVKAAAPKKQSGNARGQLQKRIIKALKAAGPKGDNIKGLAAKFKMPYRNIQVWFATTGKRNPAVKKIGPATYQIAG